MNAESETTLRDQNWVKEADITLPAGLMGFSEVKQLELIHTPEELPFRWLRSVMRIVLSTLTSSTASSSTTVRGGQPPRRQPTTRPRVHTWSS